MKCILKLSLLLSIILLIVGCKKAISVSKRILPDTLISVILHPENPGIKIPSDFLGLSYETDQLSDPHFLNKNNKTLLQLFKNIGPGYLRVGGNSSDRMIWTGQSRSSATQKNQLTTTDIDRFANFAKVVDWKILFGLNLGQYNVDNAVIEAGYVYKKLDSLLYAFQIGNEVDIYGALNNRYKYYDYSDFQPEWRSYFYSIKSQYPNTAFAGPDAAFSTSWIHSLVTREYKNVNMVTGHYYRAGPATDAAINISTLLTEDEELSKYLSAIESDASKYNLPYRISECNSIFGGGKKGTSDVFASALWALDFMWEVALHSGHGVNFHGGSDPDIIYSPIIVRNGQAIAAPIYYSFLAFKAGIGGNVIPAQIDKQGLNLSVFSTIDNNKIHLTLINKDENFNINFYVLPGINASSAKALRLNAPFLTSTKGITWAGSTINNAGEYKVLDTSINYINAGNRNFIINVPSGSAVVLTIQ